MIGIKVLKGLYSGICGILAGLIFSMALSQWVWLSMRFNIGLLIPLCTLIGMIISIKINSIKPVLPLFLEGVLLVTILVIYGSLSPIFTIPSSLLRDGIYLDLTLKTMNAILITILFFGTSLSLGVLIKNRLNKARSV